MKARPPTSLLYGALVLQTMISAGTYLSAKRALAEIPWPALVMLRNVGATVLLVFVVALAPGPLWPTRKAWPRVLALGLLGVPLNQALFLAGLVSTTPAHAALLYTLTPLFVLTAGLVTRTERVEPRKLLGLFVALAGAALVVLERAPGQVDASIRGGDFLILLAVVAWAGFTIAGKPLVQAAGPMKSTGWALISGTLLFVPFGADSALHVDYRALAPVVWGALVFLVVLTSVVSYLCWYYALEHLEPSRVAVFTNLQPVCTAAASWMLLGERITPRLALGGVAVIAGVLLATRARNVVLEPE